MEDRVFRLETDMSDVKSRLTGIETRLGRIEKDMLTKGQAAIFALGTVLTCGAAIFGAGWWVVQAYLAPLLADIADIQRFISGN